MKEQNYRKQWTEFNNSVETLHMKSKDQAERYISYSRICPVTLFTIKSGNRKALF